MKVEIANIDKRFGPVRANQDISVSFPPGGVYGLLGENGAGKSTLMKILSGLLEPDRGRILLDGRPVAFNDPGAALAAGIGFLPQDPSDFRGLSAPESFQLGQPTDFIPDGERTRVELLSLARSFGFQPKCEALVGSLTVGERQQLEILRLLSLKVEVLILDEPTTGISAAQRITLFTALRRLASEGKIIILVSHKLEDVQEICQRVTVLRQGKVAGQISLPCSNACLVEMMFGQILADNLRPMIALGEVVLELTDLAAVDGERRISGLNLAVLAGEVIGLAGLEGSGQSLLLRTCAGLLRPSAGRLCLGKVDLTGAPYACYRTAGVAYLPADRLEEGLIPGMNLFEHLVLAGRGKSGIFVDWKGAKERMAVCIKKYNIKGRPETPVETLSGGNQQRLLLALLPETIRVLLMEHPTRGLDLESAHWCWQDLLERRNRGTAIIFTSTDAEEILEYSDRVMVFSGGKATPPLPVSELTANRLGELIGGAEFLPPEK